MNLKLTICLVAGLLLGTCAGAVPARPGFIRVKQPDGRSVQVRILGDESANILLSADGCAIGRGEDGCFRYKIPDASGGAVLTDFKPGDAVPASVKGGSAALGARALVRVAEQQRRAAHATVGQRELTRIRKVAVIPAQFRDLAFSHTPDYFEALLMQDGYSYRGATGCVHAYFQDQLGPLAPSSFVVTPVVTLSEGFAYYGANDASGKDRRAFEAASEACRLADPSVDFAQYDAVVILYAGANPADGGASDDHIWPNKTDREIRTDEKTFSSFAMTSELMLDPDSGQTVLAGIGVFCHEFAHLLGLPDFYDTDYAGSLGESSALWGSTSLMDHGTYNNKSHTPPCLNGIELMLLGAVEPEQLLVGSYELAPLSQVQRVFWAGSDDPDEYFLFECRAPQGWDRYIGISEPGMLVYHVDRSGHDAGYSEGQGMNLTAIQRWMVNEVNANPSHLCADLLEADPDADRLERVFFPCGGHDAFTPDSPQPFVSWSGKHSSLSLLDIRREDGHVTFRVVGPVVMDQVDAFQDAVILNWHTDDAEYRGDPAQVFLSSMDGTSAWQVSVPPYGEGRYSITFEHLSPHQEYQVSIGYPDAPNARLSSLVQTFTTRSYTGNPYIYLNDAERTPDGKFVPGTRIPLRVFNAPDALVVGWFLDGERIQVGDDGYYRVTKGGLLRAEVNYPGGVTDIIMKRIVLR